MVEIERICGLKKTSIYALIKKGLFPPPLQLTARCVAWSELAVLQWVQDRVTASEQANYAPHQPLPTGRQLAGLP